MYEKIVSKKAQASIEFIASYSWILLSILATIGALMYFNVLNPERYMSDECDTGTNIYCEDWSLQKQTPNTFGLSLKLRNNLEKSIIITNAELLDKNNDPFTCLSSQVFCPFSSTSATANWTAATPGNFEGSWGVGKVCRIDFSTCTGALIKGDKDNYHVEIGFKRKPNPSIPGDNPPEHTIKGRIFTSP